MLQLGFIHGCYQVLYATHKIKHGQKNSTLMVLLFLSAQLKNICPLTENCRLQIVKSNSETSLTDFEG